MTFPPLPGPSARRARARATDPVAPTRLPLLPAALLLSACLSAPAGAQWTSDPGANTALASGPGAQTLPKVASLSDGGLYVGWFDNATGAYVVRLQRLDADGVPQWGADGLLVSDHPQGFSLVDWDLVCDAADHAVLVFTDTRDGPDRDVFAYRIAPDGAFAWGPDGLALSSNDDFETAPRVAEADGGDLVFVWARLPGSSGQLMMQRITPAGDAQLQAGGLPIVSPAFESPGHCDVAAAGPGAVVVSWVRDIAVTWSPHHVRARRFDLSGAPLWPDHVDVYDAASLPVAHEPGLVGDGAGGALLWWHVPGASGLYDARVQHLDADGTELLPHDGLAVSTSATTHQFDPDLVYDEASGDAYVVWNERDATQTAWGIRAQRISAAGTLPWGATGLELLATDETFKSAPRALPAEGGASVFVGHDPFGGFVDLWVRGLRLDAAGDLLWPPTTVSSVSSGKTRFPATVDCTGAVKLVWQDDRDGTLDLYGQRIAPDGSLGGGTAWTDLGEALAGSAGAPQLAGAGALCPGLPVSLTLTGALADTTTTLVMGLSTLGAPFKGGTLVPDPLLLLPGLPTGPLGTLALSSDWPPGLPSGVSVYMQHWIVDPAGPDGYAASNGLRGTQP